MVKTNSKIILFSLLVIVTFPQSVSHAAVTLGGAESVSKMERDAFEDESSNATFAVGPQLGVIEGETGYGLSMNFLFDLNDQGNLYGGVQTGFTRWELGKRFSRFEQDVSLLAIPVLPTLIYYSGSGKLRPYIGASIGASFMVVSASSASDSQVFFNGMARLGTDYKVSQRISAFIEPQLGILETTFFFQPILGINFSI